MNNTVSVPSDNDRASVDRQPERQASADSPFTWAVRLDELAKGQIVIVTARWILVATVLALALWNANSLGELRIQLLAVLALAGMNFYIHAHLLMKRAFPEWAVYAATTLDLTLITVITAVQGGYSSNVFLFYFPAMLGFSVAFPSLITVSLVGATAFWYGVIGLATTNGAPDAHLMLASRLIMLAGTAACGILYQRLERKRREAVMVAHEQLKAEIQGRSISPLPGNLKPDVIESPAFQEGV